MLGPAGPGNRLGCSLLSFHFLWAILCPQAVQWESDIVTLFMLPELDIYFPYSLTWSQICPKLALVGPYKDKKDIFPPGCPDKDKRTKEGRVGVLQYSLLCKTFINTMGLEFRKGGPKLMNSVTSQLCTKRSSCTSRVQIPCKREIKALHWVSDFPR